MKYLKVKGMTALFYWLSNIIINIIQQPMVLLDKD